MLLTYNQTKNLCVKFKVLFGYLKCTFYTVLYSLFSFPHWNMKRNIDRSLESCYCRYEIAISIRYYK